HNLSFVPGRKAAGRVLQWVWKKGVGDLPTVRTYLLLPVCTVKRLFVFYRILPFFGVKWLAIVVWGRVWALDLNLVTCKRGDFVWLFPFLLLPFVIIMAEPVDVPMLDVPSPTEIAEGDEEQEDMDVKQEKRKRDDEGHGIGSPVHAAPCVPEDDDADLESPTKRDGSDSHPFNETLDESCMLGYAVLTLLVSFQKLLSPQTLDVWYLLLQTLITVPMLFETRENLEKTSKASLFFRLLLATLARRTWLVILANILYWVAVVHHTNFSPSCDIFQSLTLEIVLLLVTVVAVRLQQYSWTCTTLDLKSARVDLDASSTLLRSLCDTVVEVDSDLKILQKSKTSCCVPALPICNGKGGNLLSFF
ncbi:UVR8, partial [Symbiodinium sp. CCMP2456]